MIHITPFTVRPVLRLSKANAKGLCPISVCITIGGKQAYVSTGKRVAPAQWEGGRVHGHVNAALYNNAIAKQVAAIEAELIQKAPADIKAASQVVAHDRGAGSFIEYAAKVLPELPIAPNTLRRWEYDLEHVRKYAPELKWGQITPEWCKAFNKHLCGWMQQNSARKTFVFIRRIFNEARADGTTTLYPFKDWKLPPEMATKKQYLTMDEIAEIHALLMDRHDYPEGMRSTLAHFLLECYSGIRFSDWNKWQTERLTDGDSLHLVTTKTGEPIYLPLKDSPKLKEIVDYIRAEGLSYPYTVQYANSVLSEVTRHLKWTKHVTTHVGRHSCGTLLLQKGFSKETVAEVLGVSIRVVDVYAKVTRQKVRGEFERIGGL